MINSTADVYTRDERTNPIQSEKDWAKKLVDWLIADHWEVFQEVRIGGMGSHIVDIIAKQGVVYWAIEVKKSLSMALLAQGRRNLRYFHYSSVAIPHRKRKPYTGDDHSLRFAIDVLRMMGIGLLSIGDFGSIEVLVPPKLLRKNHKFFKTYFQDFITDKHRYFVEAGGNRGGYFTPYKEQIQVIRNIVKKYPNCTADLIMKKLSEQVVMMPTRAAVMQWLRKYETNWCITNSRPGHKTTYSILNS